jgi:hypothetical protein
MQRVRLHSPGEVAADERTGEAGSAAAARGGAALAGGVFIGSCGAGLVRLRRDAAAFPPTTIKGMA